MAQTIKPIRKSVYSDGEVTMPIIHQVSVDEIIARLPELEPLEETHLNGSGCKVILFAAAGFEDRARALIEQFPPSVWDDLLLVCYPTNEADNESTRRAYRHLDITGERTELLYDKGTLWQQLDDALTKYNDGNGCAAVVDVSGMSSYVLYPLLESIRQKLPRALLGIIYFEADEYHPRKEAWTAFRSSIIDLSNSLEIAERYQQSGKFESEGPTTVYGSQLYPGINVDGLATQLVAIPSFSLERMKEMVAHAEDQYNAARDEVRWVFGNPPDRQKNGWRLDAQIELYCAQDDQRSVAVSTRNYTDLVRVLDELWEETTGQRERHMVIATVGSKMQHVGTFIFLCMHPEVGIILSEPKEFIAKQYSNGCGPGWWLNLGPVETFSALLRSRGTLRFQW